MSILDCIYIWHELSIIAPGLLSIQCIRTQDAIIVYVDLAGMRSTLTGSITVYSYAAIHL